MMGWGGVGCGGVGWGGMLTFMLRSWCYVGHGVGWGVSVHVTLMMLRPEKSCRFWNNRPTGDVPRCAVLWSISTPTFVDFCLPKSRPPQESWEIQNSKLLSAVNNGDPYYSYFIGNIPKSFKGGLLLSMLMVRRCMVTIVQSCEGFGKVSEGFLRWKKSA